MKFLYLQSCNCWTQALDELILCQYTVLRAHSRTDHPREQESGVSKEDWRDLEMGWMERFPLREKGLKCQAIWIFHSSATLPVYDEHAGNAARPVVESLIQMDRKKSQEIVAFVGIFEFNSYHDFTANRFPVPTGRV